MAGRGSGFAAEQLFGGRDSLLGKFSALTAVCGKLSQIETSTRKFPGCFGVGRLAVKSCQSLIEALGGEKKRIGGRFESIAQGQNRREEKCRKDSMKTAVPMAQTLA